MEIFPAEKMTDPLVSVVMVTRNADRYLTESIESILGQSFGDFEFLIVDFGSNDRSKSIAGDYASRDARVKLIEISNCGLPDARNAACSLARGRYIAVMDADDVSLPHRLRSEVDFMEKNPEVGLLGGAAEWITASGQRLFVVAEPTGGRALEAALLTRSPFRHSTIVVRKEVFIAAGGYRRAFQVAEDYDLFLRIAERTECANLEQVVLKYRVHANQESVTRQREMTYCKLAAQLSLSCRKRRDPDPLDSADEVTAELLARLDVDEAKLASELASDCKDWVHNMFLAGEHAVALKAALEFLQSDLTAVRRSQIGDIRFEVAKLYWAQNRHAMSLLTSCRAVTARPVLSLRFLKAFLRRLQPV